MTDIFNRPPTICADCGRALYGVETCPCWTCSCGAPATTSLTPGEVVVHRYDGRPCYIAQSGGDQS